jgi:hypothetical protein
MFRFFPVIVFILFVRGMAGQFIENGGSRAWLTASGVIYDAATTGSEPRQIMFTERFSGMEGGVVLETGAPVAIAVDRGKAAVFAGAEYRQVWRGIDVRLTNTAAGMQHEYLVQPGADAGRIAVALEGIQGVTVDGEGGLEVAGAGAVVRQGAPECYQEIGGSRIAISVAYKLIGPASYGFETGSYARQFPLVIRTGSAAAGPALAPVVTYFNVAPTSTLPGQAVIGTLLVTGATSATVNGVNANCSAGSCGGTFLFAPPATTNYVMQALGAGGTVTQSQLVQVGKYLPNPPAIPAGLTVTWQGACWLKGYPKTFCSGACQGMAFTVNIPAPPAQLPLEATLYLNSTKCNPASQDNLNDTGAPTGSGSWINWFINHPNVKNSSAIWTIGNQSSGCVSYATAPKCP